MPAVLTLAKCLITAADLNLQCFHAHACTAFLLMHCACNAGMRVSAEDAAKGLRRRSSRLSRVSDDSALGLTSQLPLSSRAHRLRGSKSFAEDQVSTAARLLATAVSAAGPVPPLVQRDVAVQPLADFQHAEGISSAGYPPS